MDEMTKRKYKAGIDAIRGARDECETVAEYLERLIATYETSPEDGAVVEPQYLEIIRDELNHALRFMLSVFAPVTGIEPSMDGLEGV